MGLHSPFNSHRVCDKDVGLGYVNTYCLSQCGFITTINHVSICHSFLEGRALLHLATVEKPRRCICIQVPAEVPDSTGVLRKPWPRLALHTSVFIHTQHSEVRGARFLLILFRNKFTIVEGVLLSMKLTVLLERKEEESQGVSTLFPQS